MARMPNDIDQTRHPLLAADDPPAFAHLNPGGRARFILVCDHASLAVPKRLGTLGLDPADLRRHIGWDIGAAEVTRILARRLDAQAFLSGFSRLVVDCNRRFEDPSSIPEVSDRTEVPGNRNLAPAERTARIEACFRPYHNAIAATLDRLTALGQAPGILSIHSFTPVFDARHRPWHVGVLWHKDGRIAKALIATLAADPAITVGDNEPYDGASPHAYSMPVHGLGRGLPHAQFEIRQDLIGDAAGVALWADRLHHVIAAVMSDPAIYRVERF